MPTQPQSANGADLLLQPYLDFWSSYVEQARETTGRMLENANVFADPRAWRSRWLEAVSQSTDAYLRSPLFLSAMKQNMDAAIKTKMQTDDLQKEFARNANIPTAGDISGLFERLHGVEEQILTRLSEIEERLASIESRLVGDLTLSGEGGTRQVAKNKRTSAAKKKAAPQSKKQGS